MKPIVTPVCLMFAMSSALVADDETPISGEFAYTGEVWQVASGGLERDARYLHNLDLTLEWDLEKSGIDGGRFFFYGLSNNGGELSGDLVGDAQVVSNIDNSETYRLYEAWYEKNFDATRIKLGLIDLNSEFDAIDTAGFFINSSHGIGADFSQTGENGPSIFPSTSTAFLVEHQASDRVRLMAGVFDAVPNDPDRPGRMKLSLNEGALFVGEANFTLENDLRIAIGGYQYSSAFEEQLSGDSSKGNGGFYGIVEAPFNDRISAWARLGFANSKINPASHYLGGGFVVSAPFESRPDDQFGIAFAAVYNGDDYKQVLIGDGEDPAGAEYNFEMSYALQLTDSISIQPDVQYIINTGGVKGIGDTLVVGVRFGWGMAF